MNKKYLPAILFLIICFILYGRSINYDFVLDDSFAIENNAFVQKGLSGIADIWSHGYFYGFNENNAQLYRPLTQTVLATVSSVAGMNPGAFHFINIFGYFLIVLLIFYILKPYFPDKRSWVPWLAALLFAIHPLHIEVVANIKSIDEILAMLFGLAALQNGLKYYASKGKKYLWFALLFLALSAFSKESGIMFALIIPLTALFLITEKTSKDLLKETLFFIVPVAAYLIVRILVIGSFGSGESIDPINNSLLAGSFAEQFATAIQIIGRYLLLLLVPFKQSWDYSYNQIPLVGLTHWSFLLSLTGIIVLIFFAFRLRKTQQLFSLGVFWFFVMLLPASNLIIPIGATMAERFVFAPSLGFIMAFIALVMMLSERTKTPSKQLQIRYAIPALSAMIYLLSFFSYIPLWQNNFTLAKAGIERSPNSARAQLAWSVQLKQEINKSQNQAQKASLTRQAMNAAQKALSIYPDYATAAFETGDLYFLQQDMANARKYFRKCLKSEPQHVRAINNIGVSYIQQGRNDSALFYFDRALQIDPKHPDALANKGLYYYQTGQKQKAVDFWEESLKYKAHEKQVLINLMHTHNELGNKEKARFYQQKAMQVGK